MTVPQHALTIAAQHYADKEAERIAADPALSRAIKTMYEVQRCTTRQIYETMNGSLGLSESAKVTTNIGVVQRVVFRLCSDAVREEVYSKHRSDIFESSSRSAIKEARSKWQAENGLVVFSDEESAHLFALRGNPDFHKGQRVDNQKVADAMNAAFDTTRFTKDNCRQRAANASFLQRKKSRKEAKSDMTQRSVDASSREECDVRELNDAENHKKRDAADQLRLAVGRDVIARLRPQEDEVERAHDAPQEK